MNKVKKIVPQFEGRVKDGVFRLHPKERKLFHIHCSRLKNGIYYLPAPKRFSGIRSGRQNRYYWVLMTILEDVSGHTKEEMHELCKYMFLSEIHPVFNIRFVNSSALADKWKFVEYIDDIRLWAAMGYLDDGTYPYTLSTSVILPEARKIDLTK